MSVERITVETNDGTGNNPVGYDWEFDLDGTFRMTGDGDIPASLKDSTDIMNAFADITTSILDGECVAAGDDGAWLEPFAAMLVSRIPFVSGSVETGLTVTITSPVFLSHCRSMWIGADVHRGMGRYLNLRWDTDRGEWVEAGMNLPFPGADAQVAFMLETAMREGDGIRFDPEEGGEMAVGLFRTLLAAIPVAGIPFRWEA